MQQPHIIGQKVAVIKVAMVCPPGMPEAQLHQWVSQQMSFSAMLASLVQTVEVTVGSVTPPTSPQ